MSTDTTPEELIRKAQAVVYESPLPGAIKRAVDERLGQMLRDPGAFGMDSDELPREVLALVAADPEPPQSFIAQVVEMEPDDVVLIGGVTGGREAIQHFQDWARAEWPTRQVVLFADDIDVQTWRGSGAVG